jgi:hypothetical protein
LRDRSKAVTAKVRNDTAKGRKKNSGKLRRVP